MEQKEINKNVERLGSLSVLISEIIKERQKERGIIQHHLLSIEDLRKVEAEIDNLRFEMSWFRNKKREE